MQLVKSIIFSFLVGFLGMAIPIIYCFAFFKKDSKLADIGAKNWAIAVIWLAKKLCKINYQIIGRENIPSQACIIACKHQSMWETVIMHIIINRPVYTYKKELQKIPFYGWYLQKMSCISIDRKGGASSLKALIKQAKFYLEKNQQIVIFPQGTRVPVGKNTDQYPYHAGISALYKNFNLQVVPAALNSGLFWPKSGFRKNSGTITIEFLPPILPGLNKDAFMQELESKIELATNKITN